MPARSRRRADDTEDVIRHRLALYREVTEPILGWYNSRGILVSVGGERPVDDLTREILTALEMLRSVVDAAPEGERRSVDLTGLDAAFHAAPQGSSSG